MPVLFDLDGTLLDTAPDFTLILNKLRTNINLPPLAVEEVRASVSEGVSYLIQTFFGLKRDDPQSEVLCSNFLKLYEENICCYTQPFPGMLLLLNALETNNIPWGIVTNKANHLTCALLKKLSLLDRAACVVSGDTTPYQKPHPAPLLYACKILNAQPSDCIYIGDAARDIQAGKAAGMTTIGALFGYITGIEVKNQWGADHYVHTVEELWPLIIDMKKIIQ